MGDVLAYVTGRQQLFYRLKCNLSYSWCFTREELDDLSRSPTDEAEKLFHCHDFLTPTHTFLTITTLFTCPVLMYIRVNSRLPIHHRGNSPTPIHLHLFNINHPAQWETPPKNPAPPPPSQPSAPTPGRPAPPSTPWAPSQPPATSPRSSSTRLSPQPTPLPPSPRRRRRCCTGKLNTCTHTYQTFSC